MVFVDLNPFTSAFTAAAVAAGTAALSGLDVVEAEIEDVVHTINNELEQIQPARVAQDGRISPASFGGAERAPYLSVHYDGAVEARRITLEATKDRLIQFRDACIEARQIITDTDLEARDELTRTQLAVAALSRGALPFQNAPSGPVTLPGASSTPEGEA